MERPNEKTLSPNPGPNFGTGGVVGPAGGSAIRDRMPGFHEDSRNPGVSPAVVLQEKPIRGAAVM